VKNNVEITQSGDHSYVTVHGIENMKGLFRGRGLVYSWIQGVDETAKSNCEFVLLQPAPVDRIITEVDQVDLEFYPANKFPCSGVVTSTGEGYMIAPAIRLRLSNEGDMVAMLLTPPTRSYDVSVEKTVLAIPGEEATLTLSTEGNELRCLGTFSRESKMARVILNRNPRLPVYKSGFNETLAERRGPGQIRAVWKPVGRSFEELVLVFDPSTICSFGAYSLAFGEIPNLLTGAEVEYTGREDDHVIGDGVGVSYTIRLLLDRGLGRHSSDEARITVS
jgi:hypothetical protein